ncbi:hypothetical protein ABPG74_006212 [Tetrahymena malaccensis]
MNLQQGAQKSYFQNEDLLNSSYLTVRKSDTLISQEKSIKKANQSNLVGGNLKLYQEDSSLPVEYAKINNTEEKTFLEDISLLKNNKIEARQNTNQAIDECLITSENQNKKISSLLESSTQKVEKYQPSIIALSNIIQQKQHLNLKSKIFFSQIQNQKKKEVGFSINFLTNFKMKTLGFYRNFTYSGKAIFLNHLTRKVINDLSDYHLDKQAKQKFMSFKKTVKCIEKLFIMLRLNKLPLFNPENIYRIIFNSILMSYNCFYLLLISFMVFFNAEFKNISIYHEIAITSWITEMFINMNTSNYHHGQFITDRKIIFKIYVNEYFFFEIIPLIFENLSSSNIYINNLFKIPLLLKIKGIMIIYEKIEFFILHSIKRRYTLEILKLIFKLILLTHIMACSYNAFASFETHILEIKETWKTIKQSDDWYFYYAQAQTWAFATMCNTTSQTILTTQEYLFSSLWMLISSIAFAYLINKIGSILSDLNQQEESYRDDINVLNQFMKRKQINLGLQRMLNLELKQYYKQEELKKKIDVQGTLSKLSKHMYKELMSESYKKVLNQIPYFQNYISENNLSKIYEIMEEIGYSQHQIIESNDFEDDISIYFVLKGQCKYIIFYNYYLLLLVMLKQCLNYDENSFNKSEEEQQIQEKPLKKKVPTKDVYKDIKQIKKGQFFGMYEFLTGQKRLYIAESQNVSIVIRLPLNKFLDIIKADEKDYQKYLELRDKLNFNQNISFFNIPCYTCGQVDHFFTNCSKTHFTKDNPFLIPKHNFSLTQDRNPNYERKSRGQYKMIFQEVEEEEDDCISQKSSSYTGQKNDRSHEDQYSYFEIEKEQMERPELRGNRGSTYYFPLSQQKRHSIEEKTNEDPIIIISQANEPYIQKVVSQKTLNSQSQDQDQQGYLRQSKNSEYLDEQLIENLKNSTKVRRASSNKFLNSSLSRRFSTTNNNNSKIKRYSVDDMTPKIQKNSNLNQIEETGESFREMDYSFSDMNKQNSFNSNRNSLTIFGIPTKQRKSSFNLQTYSQFTNLKPYQLDSQFKRMQIEWKDSMDYWRFDKLAFFKYYFADYNYQLVIRKIQKYKLKKNIKLKTDKIILQQNSQFKKLNTLLKKKPTNHRSLQHLQTKIAKNE